MSDATENKQFNPLADNVIHRDYTGGLNSGGNVGQGIEDFEEPQFIPFSEEPTPEVDDVQVVEPTQPSQPRQSSSSDEDLGVKGASSQEKRRNAEKAAEGLLAVYAQYLPRPFKHLSKFKDGDIAKLEMNNEINTQMIVTADGQTVGGYIQQTNSQVDQIFTVTDEQLEEVKEPLIDYLVEKDIQMSPAARLGMAIGSHIFAFGVATFQMWQQNKDALNTFKEFHQEAVRDGYRPNLATHSSQAAPKATSPENLTQTEEYVHQPREEAQEFFDNKGNLHDEEQIVEFVDIDDIPETESNLTISNYMEMAIGGEDIPE